MKDFGFKIKISDLLNNPGSSDIVNFEKKFTKNIPEIDENGISGKVYLFGSSPKSIDLIIKELKVSLNKNCEICGKNFKRKVEIKDYDTTFVLPEIHHDITEKIHDEEFLINPKDLTIDIEELVCQAINLNNPIVEKCENCKKIVENDIKEINDEDFLTEGGKINIIFVKK